MFWKVGGSCVFEAFGYNGGMENKKQEQLDLLAKKAFEHDKRFDAVDERFDEHDKRFDNLEKLGREILSLQDQTLTLLRKQETEQVSISAAKVRHDKAIEGHEKRIVRLERKAGIEQVVAS